MRRDVVAGAAAVGAVLVGAAAVYYFREKSAGQPDYRVLQSEGEFEIRSYPAITVAETIVAGARRDALSRGYRILSDYLTGESREGEPLPMAVPVLQDSGNPMASDPPLFDDTVEGRWRIRFVMPEGLSRSELPDPPDGVDIVELGERRVGAVRFSGLPSDSRLSEQEDRLRGWLARHDEPADTEPEYAFYNSPMIPPPLRRNEVLIPLA
jgi:hypothetical protein